MNQKTIIKIAVDIIMTVMLLVLMAYRITGELPHEWIGAGMFALLIAHHILNRFWYRSLGKGKYTAFRVFQTAINLLLLPCMAGLIISGIIMSRHVFAFLPISGGLSLARMMHLVCAYWGFVLMSIHIGLHWGMIMGMARKAAKLTFSSYKRTALLRAAAVIIAGYGIYAFIARQMPQYMLLIIQFAFFDYEQPKILFFADYLAVMGSFIFLGHYAAKFLRHRTARNSRTSGSDS